MPKHIFLGVFSLIFALFARPVKADQIHQVDFTVGVLTGPEAGDVFTGSYTYDVATFNLYGSAPVLSFAFTDPAWSGATLSSPGVAFSQAVWGVSVGTFSMRGLNLFFAPLTGENDSFLIDGNIFGYGTATVLAGAIEVGGEGTVSYTGLVAPTPEPGSFVLLGTSLLALAGIARRPFMRA